MSSRWRERKATLVSSAELQARRKALLAPVQRYRRGWVQLRADSAYKVLKWVPRDMVPGTTSSVGQLEGFFEEADEIDASTDEEEEEEEGDEREGDDSEVDVVGSGRGRSTGEAEETNEPSSARSHKGLKMERKTSKAVEDTERVGGQLAGLETGQIAEQIEIDEDDEEEEELGDQTAVDQEPQSQTFPMDEDEEEDGREQAAMIAPYSSHSEPAPLSTTTSILPPGQQTSTNDLSAGHIPGLRITAELTQPSYTSSTDQQPLLGATSNTSQPIPSIVYPTQAPELGLEETDQGLSAPLSNTSGAQSDLDQPEQVSAEDPGHMIDSNGPEIGAPTIDVSGAVSGPEDPSPDASMA
ncbi:hypothetical protein PGT21_020671 [Puccinia graminis f. sp. tritici]|uniref:Uncharacterized protein n=1 Tax=Puccinia graminis f. sp. tritici TaxID=56615 RepID=A0A5B0LYA4_PUCGR|nr:hypothetical protein PGTUg99_031938 [Puccinia graminis f. sp. tritici]KAA1104357.1 hypothetical protein PGT21_020671 [Puccinia graminis f. sp. tritici]